MIMISISGCSQTSPENSFCDKAKPIYLDKADKLSEETKREIYEHFKVGEDLCGWQPLH